MKTMNKKTILGTFPSVLGLMALLICTFLPTSATAGSQSQQASTITTIDVPGATSTAGQGINASGDFVGFYTDETSSHGFVLSKGAFTFFDVPGALDTLGRGINARGDIVGEYDNDGVTSHGSSAAEAASPR